MNAVLKYPGAKWRISDWIISYFPAHKVYLEPFFGSGAVFFTKEPSQYETVNDIDGMVTNFFRACRDFPESLADAICLTPFSRDEFMSVQENHAGEDIKLTGDCVEDARRFLVRCHQSFGSKLSDRAGWKNAKTSSGPNNPLVWNKLPGTILSAAGRLKNAQIENMNAIELIAAYNAPDCLIYADPPYPRGPRDKRMYRHEMMEMDEHKRLLDTLQLHSGPVVLSGYDNALYNECLPDWHKETIDTYVNSGRKTQEVLWMNFKPSGQISLFDYDKEMCL